jgi:hypothetical protein
MKKKQYLSIAATLLLMLGVVVQAQTPSQTESPPWQMYTIDGEDFSVALPLLPALHLTYDYLDEIPRGCSSNITLICIN